MFQRSSRLFRFFPICVAVLFAAACATAPSSERDRGDLRRDADDALALAKSKDQSLGTLLERAAGYAVFPSVGKGAVGVGGAYGRGILYENEAPIGFTALSQATIGLQLGGQSYTEILVFEDMNALNRFRQGNFAFSSQATAVALRSGEGANAKFENGVAAFTMDEAGLMFEASVGGQKFSYQPFAEE